MQKISNIPEYSDIKFVKVNAPDFEQASKKGLVENLPYIASFFNGDLLEGTATTKEEKILKLISNLKD